MFLTQILIKYYLSNLRKNRKHLRKPKEDLSSVFVVVVNTVFEVINDSSWAAEMHAEESIKAATQGE